MDEKRAMCGVGVDLVTIVARQNPCKILEKMVIKMKVMIDIKHTSVKDLHQDRN